MLETKICHLKEIEPIKEVLRYVMVLVGLRAQNFPNEAEKAVLLDFIIKNYGGHTPSEIKLAFTMALQGKLSLDGGFSVICYENFSVVYFAGVMNAYRQWAKEAINFVPKSKIEKQMLPAAEVSDEEFIESVRKLYEQNKDYKKIPVLAYKVLATRLSLTTEKKMEIMQIVHETTKDGDLKELAKQYAVKEYFDGRI